ncbi:hypothetical protein L915_07185 [Phytophthora nicotianae]|uniref:Uncharacterized protein n=1 Tax=Phytophthora nicotianae TaxID=4792 RepID=W2H1Z9_PHYNI|nr:hypothetical protein L915_07185 [Phytophthora nicotianae]
MSSVSNKPGLKKERDSPKTSSNLTFGYFTSPVR